MDGVLKLTVYYTSFSYQNTKMFELYKKTTSSLLWTKGTSLYCHGLIIGNTADLLSLSLGPCAGPVPQGMPTCERTALELAHELYPTSKKQHIYNTEDSYSKSTVGSLENQFQLP